MSSESGQKGPLETYIMGEMVTYTSYADLISQVTEIRRRQECEWANILGISSESCGELVTIYFDDVSIDDLVAKDTVLLSLLADFDNEDEINITLNPSVVYESSDESLITIVNGMIVVNKDVPAGSETEVTITATLDGSTDSITVRVIGAAAPLTLESLVFDPDSIQQASGTMSNRENPFTLTGIYSDASEVDLTNDPSVVYESSDENIATVVAGMITLSETEEGTSTITATLGSIVGTAECGLSPS